MEHSAALGERGQGENLYASSDRKAGMKQAIGAWMGEKRYYPKGAKVGSRGEGGVGTWGHYCESSDFSGFSPFVSWATFWLYR